MRIPSITVAALFVACNRTPPEPGASSAPVVLPIGGDTAAVTHVAPAATPPVADIAPAVPAGNPQGTPAPAGGSHAAPTRPTITIPAGPAPTSLQRTDLVVGTGPEAHAGQTVSVQYSGVAWSTHREFDSSWNRGQPFSFPLGAGRVIPGWDQGVAGMRVGGRRRLTIPPALGYGERGAGADIGPNETLVFVVDLISVQ